MAPLAIIEKVDQISSSTIDVRGTFTDESSFKVPFGVTIGATSDEAVRTRLKLEYDIALAQSSVKLSLKPGAIIDLSDPPIIPPTVTPPILPTKEELDNIAYGQKVNKYRQFKGALLVGIDIQSELDAITADLIKLYIPGYEEFFAGIV